MKTSFLVAGLLSAVAVLASVSTDGSCGGSTGETCQGSTFGNCCSKNVRRREIQQSVDADCP